MPINKNVVVNNKSFFWRKNRGSLLILSIALIFVLAIVMFFAFDTITAFLNKQTLDGSAQKLALDAAIVLNAEDQAGRMNKFIAQSRQLVYCSRQELNLTDQVTCQTMQPLALYLSNQSRDGAIFLEQERERLVASRVSEINSLLMREYGYYTDKSKKELLEQFIDKADLGACSENTAEVLSDKSDQRLRQHDIEEHYLDKGNSLYLGDEDLKLPDEDKDLSFKLCKLPSLCHGSSMHNPETYINRANLLDNGLLLPKIKCDQIPSAIRLKICRTFKTLFSGQTYNLSSSSIATTSGPASR